MKFWGGSKKQKAAGFSIRGKLIVSNLIPVTFIVVLGVISYQKAADTIIANYEVSMENTIEKTSEYYELMMNTIAANCNQIAIDNALRSYYRGAYQEDPLQEKKNFREIGKSVLRNAFAGDFVSGIYAFGAYGDICTSYMDVKKLAYGTYCETQEGGEMALCRENTVFAGYHKDLDRMTGHAAEEYAFTVKRNITNQAAEPVGIIVMDVSMEAAREPLLQMDLGEGSVCALLSGDGRAVSNQEEDVSSLITETEGYRSFAEGTKQSDSVYMEQEGKGYLLLLSRVGNTGFTVCTMIPQALITSKLKDIKTATVIIVILALLISVCAGAVISTGINSSIRHISKVMKAVAEGDLTTTVDIKGKNEFSRLGDHANDMLVNTKELLQKAGKVSGQVLTSVLDVTDTSQQMMGTADHIRDTILSVNEGIYRQNEEIERCLSKMDELAEQIEQVDQEAEGAIERAGRSRMVAERGLSAVDLLACRAGDTAKVTGRVIDQIETLAYETRAITDIIDSIKGIAARTKMLSLNARIEAARLGTVGDGFAVVAEEVRKLSEESVASVERIGEIVNRIVSGTQNTVSVARESEKIVEEQESAMTDTVQAFHEMRDSVDGLAGKIEKIAGNMRHMEQSKDKTMEAVTNIAAVSKQSLESTSRMNEAARSQVDAVNELNHATGRLDEDAQMLTAAIRKFKVE